MKHPLRLEGCGRAVKLQLVRAQSVNVAKIGFVTIGFVTILVAGCSATNGERREVAGSTSAKSVSLAPAPEPFLSACAKSRFTRAACPRKVPALALPGTDIEGSWSIESSSAEDSAQVTLSVGVPTSDYSVLRPPSFGHLVIEGGFLGRREEPFALLNDAKPSPPRNGLTLDARRITLYRQRVPTALFIGRFAWNGKDGDLYLAPPFNYASSIHSDHLIFQWQRGKNDYLISLHTWEPFVEAVATLRSIVNSLADNFRSKSERDVP